MDFWRDIALSISVLSVFVSGFFIMKKLDKFLDENRKDIKIEEKKEPSYIMLTNEMSDEEITDEIHRFRETHENIQIILYDRSLIELSENKEYCTNEKK